MMTETHVQTIAEAASRSLVIRLNAEALAVEEIDKTDSSIAVMREAAEVIPELVGALEQILPVCGAPHDYTIGDVWNAQERAIAILAKAKESGE